MKTAEQEEVGKALERLRGRLRLLYFLNGLGILLFYVFAGALLSYTLDRNLHLPQILRVGLLFSLGCGFAVLAYRWWIYPLSKKITEIDFALAVERRFPELRDRLVSSLELSRENRNVSPEFLSELSQNAAKSLRELPVLDTLTAQSPLRALGAACLAFFACTAVFWMDRDAISIWAQRFLGKEVAWPQQTFLEIQIASSSGGAVNAKHREGKILVEIVRGTDLAIRAIAQGEAPESVTLHITDGKTRNMLRTGPKEFSHLFSAVREPFSFWATGGDDRDSDPMVEVTPIEPPSVSKISAKVEFPAYSGLAPKEIDGGNIEALIGSQAEIHIETAQPIARGQIRFQQSGATIAFEAEEKPNQFHLKFPVNSSDRYSVELFDAKDLKNPEGGNYPVIALPDRKPEIKLQSPNRTDIDATVKARIPVRAEIQDDYGISAATLLLKIGKDGAPQEVPLTLADDKENTNSLNGKKTIARKVLLESPIEIPELRVGDRPAHEGEILYLKLKAADNRSPEPNVAESNEIRIVFVSQEELERRIFDSLSRIKESVESLENLQKERREHLTDLLTVLEGEGKLPASEATALRNAIAGQNRVGSTSRNLATQFLDLLETAMYNRLERDANTWIQEYENSRRLARKPNKPSGETGDFNGVENIETVSAMLRSFQGGKLGNAELLGKLLEMSALSLTISEKLSREINSALEKANLNISADDQKKEMLLAHEKQKEVLSTLEKLLEKLAEWDNYQTVINLSRELIDKQKSINTRAKELTKKR